MAQATATATNTKSVAAEAELVSSSPLAGFNMDDIKHCFENLIVIDAGANLTNKKYSRDLDSVIQRAKDAERKRKEE
ncbi:hypothetical protein DOY81_013682 [Sarcophaga bullata]|nr:hypothetical protein DOY81_013682 [Sarcophaga bullata]